MKIQTYRQNKFTAIPNEALRDKRLSLKARGLLAYCLSLPDTWDFSIEGLAVTTGAGVDAIRTGVKELEKAGYLIRHRARTANGRYGAMEYSLYDTPQEVGNDPSEETPTLENPTSENPMQENPRQIKTIYNKDYNNKKIEREDRSNSVVGKAKILDTAQAALQEQGFERFWNAYPRKVSKPTARIAWNSLEVSEKLYDRIMDAVAKYMRTRQWQDVNYIPYPETFLQDERWEDDIPDEQKQDFTWGDAFDALKLEEET